MAKETTSIENTIIKLDAIGSTNDYASKLLLSNKMTIEGTVIWALNQTKGKGQRGALWQSESGSNLTFSLIVSPYFLNIEDQFMLSKVFSLGIKDFLERSFRDNMAGSKLQVRIKWPNDIYVGSQKIGGILIENIVRDAKIHNSIIGIGVNLNQIKFPKNITNPVSFKLLTGKKIIVEQALKAVLLQLNERYQKLKAKKISEIDRDYLNSLYQFGVFSSYQVNGKVITCKLIDVNKKGELLLKMTNDKIINCDLKEVIFL